MREIKFRAWSTIEEPRMIALNRGMIEVDLIDSPKWKIMQYTGLKDKNGKEIYEGDTLRMHDVYGPYIGSIEWWEDRWTVAYKGNIDSTIQHQSLMTVKNCEVIGNIYENPDLLTPNHSVEKDVKERYER